MFGNGNAELPDAEVSVPLHIRDHPEVSQLREELGRKREELEKLHRNRQEADARREELREKFDEALGAESDLDPRDVREQILELEDTLDTFEEKRLTLQSEISSLEQRIDGAAEEAREKISEEVGEPLRQLHAAYAHHLQQALKAHLKLREFDALKRGHQPVPGLPDSKRHKERPELPMNDPQFDFPGLVGALQTLRSLKFDGFDIDDDLLDQLSDLVNA